MAKDSRYDCSVGNEAIHNDLGAQALLTSQSLTEGLFGPVTRDSDLVTGLASLNETGRGTLDDDCIRWITSLLPHISHSEH